MTDDARPSLSDADFLADAAANVRRPGIRCRVCTFLDSLPPELADRVRAAMHNDAITDQAIVDTLRGPKYNRPDAPEAEGWGRHRRKHERATAA